MNGKQSVEQQLLEHLRFSGLHKDNLAHLVKIVAGFSDKKTLPNLKVFPIGIPPVYDSLEVRSVVGSKDLANVLNLLLAETAVGQIKLFPYGVPVWEYAELSAVVGPAPNRGSGVVGPGGGG